MSFEIIETGNSIEPPKIITYGVHGIGKTTFGASAPNPVFLRTEEGTGRVKSKALPLCKTLDNVRAQTFYLYENDLGFGTLVVDSLDWLETLIWKDKEEKEQVSPKNKEDFGKSYLHAADTMAEILEGFDAIRNKHGMAIILLAHSDVMRFDDPVVGPYDRYGLKLHKRCAALVEEWADAVLFATVETFTKSEDVGFKKKVTRAVSGDRRVLKTSINAAYAAKNRYGLPPTIDLSWEALAQGMAEGMSPAVETKTESQEVGT